MKHPNPPPAWVPAKDHGEWYWNHDGYMRGQLRPLEPAYLVDQNSKGIVTVVTDLLVLLVEKGLIDMAEARAVSRG